MTRSSTSELYRAARASNNLRAIRRGPAAMAKRYVRRRVYGKSMGATGRILRRLGF